MSSAAGDREQKMLDSTTQNLSERLTEVRKTLGTLVNKVRARCCLLLIVSSGISNKERVIILCTTSF